MCYFDSRFVNELIMRVRENARQKLENQHDIRDRVRQVDSLYSKVINSLTS